MLSKERCEEVDSVAASSDGENQNNSNAINQQQQVDKGNEQEMDLVPKDRGWAWMCCLGIYVYLFSNFTSTRLNNPNFQENIRCAINTLLVSNDFLESRI